MYNTSYVLDDNGAEVGRYRKTHITYNEMARGLCRVDERGPSLVRTVDLGHRIMSRTSGLKKQYEDLHLYLGRHRHADSYAPLLTPESATPWAEVLRVARAGTAAQDEVGAVRSPELASPSDRLF